MLHLALPGMIAGCLLAAVPAQAGEIVHELKIGVLSHDVPGLWSGFRREDISADVNIEAHLKPALDVGVLKVRPAVGLTVNTAGQTSHAYLDARFSYEAPSGVVLGFGFGAAVHDGHINTFDPGRKALGSRALFHIPLEIGYRVDAAHTISAYFEHTSNANSQTFNEGLDRIGVRYGTVY